MRVFVTGASGHIASAVIPELLEHGHEVTGLARSDASADTVTALGAEVRRGDLDDLDGLRAAAEQADGVIHLAFRHDLLQSGDFMTAVDADMAATQAMGGVLEGSGKPFLTTGDLIVLGAGTTDDPAHRQHERPAGGPRTDAANYVTGLAGSGVRSSVVRLAPLIHSDLDHHGFTSVLIDLARHHRSAAYIGDGANRWPAAHTRDIGVLYRLALERAPAGSTLHGVGDEGISFRTIAETIAGVLDLPTRSVTAEEAPEALGFLAGFAGLDNPTSNTKTREVLGWEPTHPGWVEDVRSGHYFA